MSYNKIHPSREVQVVVNPYHRAASTEMVSHFSIAKNYLIDEIGLFGGIYSVDLGSRWLRTEISFGQNLGPATQGTNRQNLRY